MTRPDGEAAARPIGHRDAQRRGVIAVAEGRVFVAEEGDVGTRADLPAEHEHLEVPEAPGMAPGEEDGEPGKEGAETGGDTEDTGVEEGEGEVDPIAVAAAKGRANIPCRAHEPGQEHVWNREDGPEADGEPVARSEVGFKVEVHRVACRVVCHGILMSVKCGQG